MANNSYKYKKEDSLPNTAAGGKTVFKSALDEAKNKSTTASGGHTAASGASSTGSVGIDPLLMRSVGGTIAAVHVSLCEIDEGGAVFKILRIGRGDRAQQGTGVILDGVHVRIQNAVVCRIDSPLSAGYVFLCICGL